MPEQDSMDQTQTKTQADRLFETGTAEFVEARYAEAIERYQEALALYRAADCTADVGQTLNAIGIVHYQCAQSVNPDSRLALNQLDLAAALNAYEQALVTFSMLGDRKNEAATLNNLGVTYDLMGYRAKAMEFYRQALIAIDQAPELDSKTRTLERGRLFRNVGLVHYGHGKDMQRQVGSHSHSSQIGSIRTQFYRAAKFYLDALVSLQQAGDTAGEEAVIGDLLNVAQATQTTIASPSSNSSDRVIAPQ